tara:strand:+ start:1514 stop:2926 length:1413 start_codon:yes stop_codon:yes gene_type:complete
MQTIINPLVVSVGPTNEATITPVPMTHHGGGVKKVIAVVAAVAIPIAAPAIASSIAASSLVSASVAAAMTTTAGAVVSSAIVGAGLGAITAKVTGGDVKAGAISGLIGGGIGGYSAASRPGMFGNPAAQTSTATAGTATNLSGGNVAGSGATTTPDGLTNVAYSPDGSVTASNASFAGSSGANAVGDAATALSNKAVESTGFVASMKQGLSSAGELALDRLTNPEALANAALQVGGAVAAEAIVGTPGMTAEETAAIEQYKQELQVLKQRDEAAFNQKLDAAKQYMVQAGYYDPNYFALQSANKAAISEARKLREFERKAGLTMGGVSQGDRRRAALSGGANIQSAFDRGFLTGTDLQNRAMSTGVGLIPNAPTSGAQGAYNLAVLAGNQGAAERADARAKKDNIQKFFGAFSVNRGKTNAEKERDKQLAAGLDTGSMPSLDQKKNIPENIPGIIKPEDLKKNEPQFRYT